MAADTTSAVRPVKGELPPDRSVRGRGKTQKYMPLLTDIRARVKAGEGEGQFWVIAEFKSYKGADNALARIRRGEIDVPTPSKWLFETRRDKDANTSTLYAKVLPARGKPQKVDVK